MIGFSFLEQGAQFLDAVCQIDFPPSPEWATPSKIIFELDTMRLRDFGGCGASVLVVAPYAGHSSTIADFSVGQSLVQMLLAAGFHTYCTDWKSATQVMAEYGIERYLTDLGKAVEAAGGEINLVGLCQGGWLAAMYASLNPVKCLVAAGAPLNTEAGNGMLRRMTRTLPLSYFRWMIACGGGLMRGRYMLASWKSMHPEEHYWNKYFELYMQLDDDKYQERAKRFASWYEHTLDLPGAFYLEAVDQLFQRNLLYRGELQLLGKTVSLSNVSCPVYLLAGADDDITPPEQVLSATSCFKEVETRVAPGGHIGLFMARQVLRDHWAPIGDWIAEQNRLRRSFSLPHWFKKAA